MIRYKTWLPALLSLLLIAPVAEAQVPKLEPLRYEARYDVHLAALPIGRIRMTVKEDQFGYSLKLDTKSRGIVSLFSPLRSVATVEGSYGTNRSYLPRRYVSEAEKDGDEKGRVATLVYDERGTITTRTRSNPDDPRWRPVVPMAELTDAVDPMSAFFVLRQRMRDAMERNEREVSVLTYDTARLARMKLKVVSRARIEVRGKYVDAINTVLTREPLNGYTPKELKKFQEGDPVVHVYFSADGRLMPLTISARLFYGEIKASLTEYKTIP